MCVHARDVLSTRYCVNGYTRLSSLLCKSNIQALTDIRTGIRTGTRTSTRTGTRTDTNRHLRAVAYETFSI